MHRITVIGNGFGALTAVQELRKRDGAAEITLVGPKREFLYYPSLIWVPSGVRKASDLIVPLDNFLRVTKTWMTVGTVSEVRDGGRTVITEEGDEIENDALVIASGGRFIRKLPGIENAIIPCAGLAAAEEIRDRLRAMDGGTIAIGFSANPKEPAAVRGGPMFEFLFGIDTQLRHEGRRGKFKLVFFCPAARPGQRLGDKAVDRLLDEMARRGIETHIGHKIKGFEDNTVATGGGAFAADMILFMPGLTGPAWLENSDLPLSDGGMIKADEHCRVPGFDKVYVAGDSGSFPGPDWMPKQAHMADLQATCAAKNLLADLRGKPVKETFRTELICIVDSLNKGSMVARWPRFTLVLPKSRLWHWAKRMFEVHYLRQYK